MARARGAITLVVLAGVGVSCGRPIEVNNAVSLTPEERQVDRVATIVAEYHWRLDDKALLMSVATTAMHRAECGAPDVPDGERSSRRQPCLGKGRSDRDELVRIGVDAMMRSLGDTSRFIPPADFEPLEEGRAPSPGVVLRAGGSFPVVDWVVANSPAAAAGLERHAELRAVDGVSVEGLTLAQVQRMLFGRSSAAVNLTVSSIGADERTVRLEGTVDAAKNPDCRLLAGSVLYLHPLAIGSTTPALIDALARDESNRAASILLDLRGNRVGFMDAAAELASKFVIPGRVFRYWARRRVIDQPVVQSRSPLTRPNLAVLVDGETSGSAEAAAAALHDTGRARLIGSRTKARGAVHAWVPIPAGGGIALLVAEACRLDGRLIGVYGVEPDMVVDPRGAAEVPGAFQDVPCKGVRSPSPVASDPVVAAGIRYLTHL